MIPLRDCIRSKTTPYINYILIGLTLAIYLWEAILPNRGLNLLINNYGLIPSRLSYQLSAGSWISALIPLITNIFLHGGWVHVLGNMLYLWVFGDNIEDRVGHWRYLAFYLLAGMAGGAAQAFSDPSSAMPIIGASGAVAGVLGAYVVSYHRARIRTLLILIIYITIVEIPAAVFIVLWFLLQLLSGVAALAGSVSQVAWWAHIGGFLGGLILVLLLKKRGTEPEEETEGC